MFDHTRAQLNWSRPIVWADWDVYELLCHYNSDAMLLTSCHFKFQEVCFSFSLIHWLLVCCYAHNGPIMEIKKYSILFYLSEKFWSSISLPVKLDFFIELGLNGMSTLVGHFVSSPREREKRDKRDSRGAERQGQGKKRNRNESEETEEIKTFPPSTLTCYKDNRPCPTVGQY